MKLLISFAILACQLSSIVCRPELIQLNELDDLPDIPDFRRSRDKTQYNVKVQTYNAIPNENRPLFNPKSNEDKTAQKTNPDFQPIQLTQEDVVTGSNSVYGSQSLSNSGVIYAISHGGQRSTSEPLVPAAPPQPVLMQFLSAEGTPKQASVQYIQLLKPLMMMPAQPYQQPKPLNEFIIPQTTPTSQLPTQPMHTPRIIPTYPTLSPFGAYGRQPLSGQFTSHVPSYQNHSFRPQQIILKPQQAPQKQNQSHFQPQPQPESEQQPNISQPEPSYDTSQLNINEYMPGTMPIPLSPRSSVSPMRSQYMQMPGYGNYNQHPYNQQHQPMAQRA